MTSLRAFEPAERGKGAPTGAEPKHPSALRAVRNPRAERDLKIVELREAGWRSVEISREVGLTPGYVAQILRRAGGVDRERWLRARSELHLSRAQARCDEIVARFRAGERPPRIANELGLNQQAVWRVVREAASDADRAARARVLAGRQRPRFSDEELLDGLVAVARRLGWVPTEAEYNRAAAELGLASSVTVYQRLDGWRTAIQAAGLQAEPQRRWSRWDPEACWRALESVSDQLGDPPRYRRYLELARGRDQLPAGRVVLNRLGLWSGIVAELRRRGVDGPQGSRPSEDAPARRVARVRPRLSLPSRTALGIAARTERTFSDEQLLAGVRAVEESVGHTPTGEDYRRLSRTLGLAGHATVCMRFGSWLGAVEAAGLEVVARRCAYRRRWDAEACWQALERVASELGDFPRYRCYEQLAAGREDLPSAALLRRRLGTWSQIVAALTERRGGAEAARRLEASAA